MSSIVWFSGNGNSRLVARRLSELTGFRTMPLIESGKPLDRIPEGTVVWVFPVYSWGVPPIVAKLIASIDIHPDTLHYLVLTCGDDCGYTHQQWRALIEKKGLATATAWTVIMPNTYVLLPGMNVDSPQLADKKLSEAALLLPSIAQTIMRGETIEDKVISGSMPRLKSDLIYPFFTKRMMSPKPFHATRNCIHCTRCVKRCPMANITMSPDAIPTWGNNCALCLGCYHVCPVHAVAYGKRTGSKGQYHAPLTLPSSTSEEQNCM